MSDSRFNPNEVLRDFVGRIERLGINYMLTGSMAMIIYAMPRFTMDIDIVIELEASRTEAFIETFESDYYVPQQTVRSAVSQKKMFNIINQASAFKIDCVILKDTEFQQNAFANRRRIPFKDFEICVITKEDLIISKLWWAKDSRSEIQMRDVKNLMSEGYDLEYIQSWTRRLGINELFLECRKELET